MAASQEAERAERLAVGVGAATFGIGVVLLVAPRRVGAGVGLAEDRALRVIAAADLALVPGLLAGRPRWPWMAARGALNVAIAGWLVERAARLGARRALPVAAALLLVTGGDARAALVLRRAGA